MIAYFDSSGIVKWFFDEQYSESAKDIKNKAKIVVTSVIAFPEVLSAFNRALREGRCAKSEMDMVRKEFLRIWPSFQWINASEEVIRQAGELIFTYNLRGFDAIHLASALVLKEDDGDIELFFSCFDRNLNQAAKDTGMLIHQL